LAITEPSYAPDEVIKVNSRPFGLVLQPLRHSGQDIRTVQGTEGSAGYPDCARYRRSAGYPDCARYRRSAGYPDCARYRRSAGYPDCAR